MIHDRKTLEMIDEITDEAGERLSEYATQRLADLRHVLAAGGSLTTCERLEVHDLWARYALAHWLQRNEWLNNFRKVLTDAGLSQAKAMAAQLEAYGFEGVKADLSICPLCAGRRWLLQRGFIPQST